MKVHCKGCRLTSIGELDKSKFEIRGQHRGGVFKCLHCGGGIRVSGLFLRSKPIPAEEWNRLQQVWEQEFDCPSPRVATLATRGATERNYSTEYDTSSNDVVRPASLLAEANVPLN